MDNINWYPGHMKKTREMIQENLKLVNLVIEVVDARIPISGRNPIISDFLKHKKHLLILNKTDLADDKQTDLWESNFQSSRIATIKINGNNPHSIKPLTKKIGSIMEKEGNKRKGNRAMIVGVPNSGKSTIINKLTGKKSTGTGNRPGFTKGKQWIKINENLQLLDTPGILWPKFEDPEVGLNLAFCGSIKDEIMDVADLALELIKVLSQKYPDNLIERYKIDSVDESALNTMEQIAEKRGLILSKGRIDYERTGRVILDEFRSGKIGKITLEKIDEKS